MQVPAFVSAFVETLNATPLTAMFSVAAISFVAFFFYKARGMTLAEFSAAEKAIGVRRTVVLMFTLYLAGHSYLWAANLVLSFLADERALQAAGGVAGVGVIIGAVTAPVSYLLKEVLALYVSSKQSQQSQ
jgi:hypothetical protein